MRLLKKKYKTWEGAHKRCGFENGIALSEFKNGYKAKHYRYTVVEQEGMYRVARLARDPAVDMLRHHVTGAIERGEGQAIVEVAPNAALARAERRVPTCERCGSVLSAVTWECVRGPYCKA